MTQLILNNCLNLKLYRLLKKYYKIKLIIENSINNN